MPALILGPLLRYVGERDATVWVEADGPCQVEVLGCSARTFCVAGHHYALVHVQGLESATTYEYEVALDGDRCWPEPGSAFPPSTIRTLAAGGPFEIAFGSCRVVAPHHPPHSLRPDEHPQGRGVDALFALAERVRGLPAERRPHLLVLLGDQVYADDTSQGVREFIRSRRDPSRPPGWQVADFEEYTRLYRDTWSDPPVRWLLSTVASAMVFDDHDVHDDWNTSEAWVEEMRETPWWEDRIAGGFMSYWLYQHIGNLAPTELEADETWRRIHTASGDVAGPLRAFALRADRDSAAARWSFVREMGAVRLLMIDSRAGRVLRDGRRRMVDDAEWEWIERNATGDVDHLLLGTSLPLLLAPGMHHLEAWNEAVCAGAWGTLAAHGGEVVRQGLDLEHWAAFGTSFERFAHLLAEVGAGRRGRAPATITVLSGDVHHAYVAEVGFRRAAGVRSAVLQAVCSPFRNALGAPERAAVRFGASGAGEAVGRLLLRSAGVAPPPIRWRLVGDPVFDNQVATLHLYGSRLRLRIERSVPGPALETTVEYGA